MVEIEDSRDSTNVKRYAYGRLGVDSLETVEESCKLEGPTTVVTDNMVIYVEDSYSDGELTVLNDILEIQPIPDIVYKEFGFKPIRVAGDIFISHSANEKPEGVLEGTIVFHVDTLQRLRYDGVRWRVLGY